MSYLGGRVIGMRSTQTLLLALRVAGIVVAVVLTAKAVAHLKLLLVQGAPLLAMGDARKEEGKREVSFLAQSDGLLAKSAQECPESFGSSTRAMGRYLRAAQLQNGGDPGRHGWQLVCGHTYVEGKDSSFLHPLFLCQRINDLISRKEVEGAGMICLDGDGSFGLWPSRWNLIPTVLTSPTLGYERRPDGFQIANVRLRVERDRLGSIDQDCVISLWVTGDRDSWGRDLVSEKTNQIRFVLIMAAVVLVAAIAILFVAVRWCLARFKKHSSNNKKPGQLSLFET